MRKANLPLEAASRDLALTPDARGLAAAIREVSANALRDADESLQRATTDSAADRATALGTARKHLLNASTRFEELLKDNERLARDRLDRRRLEALASDQSLLADRAEAGMGNELLKLQRELLKRLTSLVGESDPLKRGIQTAAASEFAKRASETQALIAKLRELDTAARKLNAEVRKSILDALADELMNERERAEKLQPRFETATRLAGLALPKREDVQRIAELIRQDKIFEVLTELERLARSLDRTATEFERWTAERNDPKLAAQQLAKWQDDLRARLLAASKPEKVPEVQLPNYRAEQTAIASSFEQLRLPPGSKIAALREAAIVHLRMASRRLDGDGAGADMAMRFASEVLVKLGEQLPSAADRLARGSVEFEKVQVEQEAIVAGVQLVLRSFDKQIPNAPVIQALMVKFLPWQLRQQKLAERLASLDLPGHESRRARAVVAAKVASADLNDGLPYDAIASLAWSRRELVRLRQAVLGLVPADEKADELAKKQAEVARLLSTAGERATVAQLEPVVALQLEVYRQRNSIAAPEAAALLGDALDAVMLAELSLRNGSSQVQILRRSREAAEALAVLADRLNERETDRDRVLRLASNRKQAECVAKVLAGKPLLPEASEKARSELKSEIEELLLTRVGESGQVPKKAMLEAYTRLQNKTEPDRQAADQKQLAAALSELAATMAKVDELATKPKEIAPAAPDPAEGYLPSKALADRLRERARGLRDIRRRANAIATEIVERLKPEAKGEPAIAAAQQKLRHEALAKEASELARLFDRSAEDASPSEPEAKNHAAAAERVRQAERLLVDAAKKANEGEWVEAVRLRADAERALQQAAAHKLSAAQPLDARAIASGEAARAAERAMRRAIRELERKGSDTALVERALRRAATALRLAANPPAK